MEAIRPQSTRVAVFAVAAAWIATTAVVSAPAFGIGTYITSSWATAYAWASAIVGYLNSWWGFAAAVAFAAAFGGSWTVVLIKAMLQKVGFKFAVQYATWL